jgi:carbon-monoxide dehydrogenase medium subunit
MIPAQFNYEAPSTIDEALMLLAQNPDEAKILAGGHSLIPAMKLRLAQPSLLVDIGRIKDLSYIREEGNQILIGDVQVRNKGTIGGSVAHSDPAGDWPAAIIALNAEMIAVGPGGQRIIKADDFFVDLLTTALVAGEILREIRIAKPAGRFGHSYQKVRHPASGFAVVGVAAALQLGTNGSCQSAAIGITGVASKAYRAGAVENALQGKSLNDQTVADAASHSTDGVDLNSDLYASEEYRRHLAQVYTKRAIQAAVTGAG